MGRQRYAEACRIRRHASGHASHSWIAHFHKGRAIAACATRSRETPWGSPDSLPALEYDALSSRDERTNDIGVASLALAAGGIAPVVPPL